MIGNIVIFGAFILLSAFFSASETALFSLTNIKLRRLQERYPPAGKVKQLLNQPTRLLSTIVFGNMLVNIGFASFSTAVFVDAFGLQGLLFAVLLSGIIILFLGEIFPKTLAIYSAGKLSIFVASFLDIFAKFSFPFVFVIDKIVLFFSHLLLFGKKRTTYEEEELKTALILSRKGGHITEQEKDMISSVLEFKDTWANEILTARVDIQGIDIESSQEEVIEFMKTKQHSKYPTYKDSLDNIEKVLYTKDVFLNPDKEYHRLLREPIFIPESKRIDDLLKLFWEKNERIAIVLDEYGGTAGLITLEDIIEEIFGELYDEFEFPSRAIEKIGERTYRIYGKTPIKTVNMELDLTLPEEEVTLAGFLLSQFEKIPRTNEEFYFSAQGELTVQKKKIKFVIERATAKRIVSVILSL